MKTVLFWSTLALVGASAPLALRAVTATGLSSFEGIEEPVLRYTPETRKFAKDDFVNITQVDERTFRMSLRYRSDQWDADRDTPNTDRQRAEVKGLGPHQKDGDVFEYATTWRSNPTLQGSPRFCHIFQLKATNGDSGAPLITVSIHDGAHKASVQYWPGVSKNSIPVREFSWNPGEWKTVRLRIKTSKGKDGEVLVSIDGDEWKGVRGVAVFRTDATDYRPKWGLYRGVAPGLSLGDDYIEHRDVSAVKLGANTGIEDTKLETSARKVAQSDPRAALKELLSQPVSPARATAIASVLALWAEMQPREAMAEVEKLKEDDGRADALLRVFNRWADCDVNGAIAWLQSSAPRVELDPLLWYFLTDTTLRYVDREKALVVAPLISDPELRGRAVEHVVLIWARREPDRAARYLEETPSLSSAQKKSILGKFPVRTAAK